MIRTKIITQVLKLDIGNRASAKIQQWWRLLKPQDQHKDSIVEDNDGMDIEKLLERNKDIRIMLYFVHCVIVAFCFVYYVYLRSPSMCWCERRRASHLQGGY